MANPRLPLIPSFTELEWGIRPELEDWAEVATLDMPGVGAEPLPDDLVDFQQAAESLSRWRDAAAERVLRELDELRWDRYFLVTDARGITTTVRVAARRREEILGLAFGHASLSKSTVGDRPPERSGIWDAVAQLAKQGNEAFVRYGIAQATRGGVDEETAQEMIKRFPDMELVSAVVEALRDDAEPVGDDLAALNLPMLLAKHEGCLGSTDEGFDDIVAAFPEAETVLCPEACSSSPAFAAALRTFCAGGSLQ